MATVEIVIPRSGVVEEVVVAEWLRSDGESVSEGEPIVVIESDKAETELSAPASGRLKVMIEADFDQQVVVGTILGIILT